MNKVKTLLIALVVSSCATYKVVPETEMASLEKGTETISVSRVNEWPEGSHCFEPMMYVLTLGIIPTHCVDTYKVHTESKELGQVKVISVQGWVALFMAPSPIWRYGYGSEVESEIKEMVKVAE